MRTKDFYNHDHAYQYLVGSLIRLDEKPLYVDDVHTDDRGRLRLRGIYTETGRESDSVGITSKRVNMVPVPLGMCNVLLDQNNRVYGCAAVSRLPARAWKVGLYQRNMSLMKYSYEYIFPERQRILTGPQLAGAILGKYPKFDEALGWVTRDLNRETSVAFSRNFGIWNRIVTGKLYS